MCTRTGLSVRLYCRIRSYSTLIAVRAGDYWDEVGMEWRGGDRDRLWRHYSDSVYRRFLEHRLSRGGPERVLKTDMFDEAAAQGVYDLLAHRCSAVVGIDISAQVLRAARHNVGIVPLVCGDVQRLPFRDESFDVVISMSTLDHFHSLDEMFAAIGELRRVVRPRGELLLTIDNLANPLIAVRNALPFPWLHKLGLVPYFVGATCGPRRLQRALLAMGFEVCESGALLHCPRVLAVLLLRFLYDRAGEGTWRWVIRALNAFEGLSEWPTRYVTGNFVYVRAVRMPS